MEDTDVVSWRELGDAAFEFIQPLATEIEKGLVPLGQRLGYDLAPVEAELSNLNTALSGFVDATTSIISAVDGLLDDSRLAEDAYKDLADAAIALLTAVKALKTFASSAPTNLQDYFKAITESQSADDFAVEFTGRLVGWLSAAYIQNTNPTMSAALDLLDLVTREPRDESTNPHRVPFVEYKINFEGLSSLLSDPLGWLGTRYEDAGAVAFQAIFERIERLLLIRMFFASIDETLPVDLANYSALRPTLIQPSNLPSHTLEVKILNSVSDGIDLKAHLVSVPGVQDPNRYGLGVELVAQSPNVVFKWEPFENLTLSLEVSSQAEVITRALIAPGVEPAFEITYSDGTQGVLRGLIHFEMDGASMVIKGVGGISIERIGLEVGANVEFDGEFLIGAELSLTGAEVVVGGQDADGFLQHILPEDGLRAAFDIKLGVDSDRGIYASGSGGLEVTIPLHSNLGPISLDSIYFAIMVTPPDLELMLGISMSAELGPISASVKRIGGRLLAPVSGGDPRLEFLPPTGAGLVIDAGTVVGGGYLEFDSDNKRYAGILQLEFGDIGLMAIGLITTRMPDGSKGFSMLLIITAEFDPPITLPYNFNLSGVGGLVGIHRTMLVDVIRQGLKNGTVDSILFPEDPILNAPRIISDLRAVYPPTEDRYVIGPMAILNWGSPPLIRAEIGILIEIPSPVRIVILGQLVMELPKKDSVLVEIHMDLLGIIDFDKKTFSFDATIYDSRISKFTLSGDSAMRLSWGNNPNFALSVGGLHPRFTPPPNFPSLRRLQLSLGSGNNPRINLDTYTAVTSNSTQFGAKLEVYAKKGSFSVHGYMGFDVLFIFSPFSFIADIGAGVAVKMGSTTLLSVTLDLTLSGPKPWRARGKATFKVLFVKIKVRFDERWGRGRPEPLQPINPWPLLKAALDDPGNWAAALPVGAQMVVSLRKGGAASDAGAAQDVAVLHPMGSLEIRQRVLPFNIEMDLFGNAPIAGETRYTVLELWTGPDDVPSESNRMEVTYDKEYFARSQFEQMSDSTKISAPSFEKFDAAVRTRTDEVTAGTPVNYELEYETEVIDEEGVAHIDDDLSHRQLLWNAARFYMAGSAARTAAMRTSGLRAYATPGAKAKIELAEEGYTIVNTTNLEMEEAIEENGRAQTHAEATRVMDKYLAENADRIGELQVVPSHEAAI